MESFRWINPSRFDADRTIERIERCADCRLRPQIVASGERVGGVEANAEPILILDARENLGQLVETAADRCSAPGRVLEQQSNPGGVGKRVGGTEAAEPVDNAVNSPIETGSDVRS